MNKTISTVVDDIPTRSVEGLPYPPEEQYAAEQTLAEMDAMIDEVEAALARGEAGEAEEGLELVVHLMDELGIGPEFIEDLRWNHPDILSIHNRVLIKTANALRRLGKTKRAVAMLASSVVVRRDGHAIAFDYPFEEGFNNPSGVDFSRGCAYVRPDDSWAKDAYDKLHAQLRGEQKCYSKIIDPAKRLFPNGAGRGTAVCPSIWENFYPVSAETKQGSELAMGQRTEANIVRLKMSGADGFDRGVVEMYCSGVFHSQYGLRREGEEFKSAPVPLCAGAVSVFQLATNVNDDCRQGRGVFHLGREPLGDEELQVTLTWTSGGGELEDHDLRLVRMSPDHPLDEGICDADGLWSSGPGILKGKSWLWMTQYPYRYVSETCFYKNCTGDGPVRGILDWGSFADPLDNPSLDLDCRESADGCVTPLDEGFLWGPENIRLSNPEPDAVYMVQLVSGHRSHDADARVAVSVAGRLLSIVDLHVDRFKEYTDEPDGEWPIAGYLIYRGNGWSFERDVAPGFPAHVLRTVCDDAGEEGFSERWSRLRGAVAAARGTWDEGSAGELVDALGEVGGDLPPYCLIDKKTCMAPDVEAAVGILIERGAWEEMKIVLNNAMERWGDSGRRAIVEAIDEYAKAAPLPVDVARLAKGVRVKMDESAGSLEVLMRRRGWDDVRQAINRMENDEDQKPRQEFAEAILRHGRLEKLPPDILRDAFLKSYNLHTRLELFDLLMKQDAWEHVAEILGDTEGRYSGEHLAANVLDRGQERVFPLDILKSAAIVAGPVERARLLEMLLKRGAWDEVNEVIMYTKEHVSPLTRSEIAEVVLEYRDREGMPEDIVRVASTFATNPEIQITYFELLLRRKDWATVKDILEHPDKYARHPIKALSTAMLNVGGEEEIPPEILRMTFRLIYDFETIADIFGLLIKQGAWGEIDSIMRSEDSHLCKALKGIVEKADSVPTHISGFGC